MSKQCDCEMCMGKLLGYGAMAKWIKYYDGTKNIEGECYFFDPFVEKEYVQVVDDLFLFYMNNDCHSEDGPAIILYDKNGNIKKECYYIHCVELTKEEWENASRKTKMKTFDRLLEELANE